MLLAASWFVLDWTEDGAERYPGGCVVTDAAGDVLRVTLGPGDVDCRPTYVADADDWIVKALVASEDGTFWTHRGVRPLSILRAAWQNVTTRRRISGASTLTMQAVRLIHPHPKTYWWKWKEAVMAAKMERAKPKVWILSQYLNRAPFGSNLVGVEAAAQGWFGKGAKELGLGEAALLAGMVQAPTRFRPDRHYAAALRRRDYVLGRMRELGMIDAAQLEAAQSVKPEIRAAPRPFRAPHFCDFVLRSKGSAKADGAVAVSGVLPTALDADLQERAERAVDAAAAAGGYASAAVAVRVATGEILAMAVSGDYFGAKAGMVNTATAPRPAGSTLKPFLSAQAMDRGLVTPEQRLADVPQAYRGYRPANFDARHRGRVTLREALVESLNVPFVTLLGELGVRDFAAHLRTLGFAHIDAPDESYGLGLAIGNAEVTLLELTRAYATLARCARATDADGPTPHPFSRAAAFLVADMLSGEERSAAALGHVADVPLPRFAWKTGTSSAYRDAWTVLWNPEYAIGVWCGHLSGGFGDQTLVGAKAAAPVAWKIARSIYPQNAGPWFAESPEVVRRPVCALTGRPAGEACPATETGRAIRGRSANAVCAVHVRDATGAVVTREDPMLAAFAGKVTAAGELKIASPEDGARFELVAGLSQQKIVCRVLGNPDGARLWWFLDGIPAGQTRGSEPLVLEPARGDHAVTCANEFALTATARFTVE